jgi:EmrB/QacA subfamily drug resistance transporter
MKNGNSGRTSRKVEMHGSLEIRGGVKESGPPPDSKQCKRAALTAALLSSFLTPFMASSVNVALPTIGREYMANAVLLSWVATGYLLAAAMFLVPFGKLADIHGRKRIFLAGIVTFDASTLIAALSPSMAWMIIARVVEGTGASMIFGTGVAILTSVFPPGERGRVLGLSVSSVYLGLSVGPVFGGVLTQHLGWRSIYLFGLLIGLTAVWVTSSRLKGEWAEARGERFDLAGSLLYGAGLVALMYGLSRLPAPTGSWLIGAGLAGLAIFVLKELRTRHPVLNIWLFRRNTVFAMSNLAALINYSATFAVGFLMSLYLQYVKGFSPQISGFILISQPAMMALISPVAGRLSDRVESRVLASAGMGFVAVGLVLLRLIGGHTPSWMIVVSLFVLGLGFGLFSSPNTNAIMSSVEKRFYGVAAAMVGTMRLIGQMISLGIATLIISVYVGRVQIRPENASTFLAAMHAAFVVFAALCFLGVFISLSRGRLRGTAGGNGSA